MVFILGLPEAVKGNCSAIPIYIIFLMEKMRLGFKYKNSQKSSMKLNEALPHLKYRLLSIIFALKNLFKALALNSN